MTAFPTLFPCMVCRARGWEKRGAWPEKCHFCRGRGRIELTPRKLALTLRVSYEGLCRLHFGTGAHPVTCERALDRIAKVFPEALR